MNFKGIQQNRKVMYALLLGSIIATGTSVVYAYMVYSNVIGLKSNYQIVLTGVIVGNTVTLTAKITNNGIAVTTGSILFYNCTSTGTIIGSALATKPVDSSGTAVYSFMIAKDIDWYFIAGYSVA